MRRLEQPLALYLQCYFQCGKMALLGHLGSDTIRFLLDGRWRQHNASTEVL